MYRSILSENHMLELAISPSPVLDSQPSLGSGRASYRNLYDKQDCSREASGNTIHMF